MSVAQRVRRAATDEPGSVAGRLRQKRFVAFEAFTAEMPRPLRVLDVGGTPDFWAARGWGDRDGVEVTLVNVDSHEQQHANIVPTIGDGTALDHRDLAFDVAFSNSAIEHLFTREAQRRMADEIRRVAHRYWVQTPNYWFPLEPHFFIPGWQWAPERVRVEFLLRRGLDWRQPATRGEAEKFVREVQLLSRRDLALLFPDARLVPERFGGLVKSWTAVRG
jgi:hypothetical protein